ncbi:TrkH family potassium uptake protein [Neorhizobium galegae]|uniref:TrkH family potassium uptake protein n=1 Tax=Neorhizobium galegae TaxID=399 RepID=UPI001272170B|nr:TrkH family potassium uptake protein [Neorhizobium galegae]KAA9386847.1 TrkH family potassium uptake protein [Neorhizobium galegae]KAB1115990.1 TrkH family potassium uptake protein [Neorhizobium galegae]MCM2499633.1 TrkH family potassium uptake protein [Neorhizobium galegae]MCQ1774027.1 TrkH family potassium uptake protein [Neorhizobium galegae]MCQ1778157.1 TrkH family potassium uptake protein [Neorhizobium galegae]
MNANLLRSVIYITALCALYLSLAMFLPAMVDLYYGHRDWQVFAMSGLMVGGLAAAAALATHGPPPVFNKRLGFLLVNVLWAMFSVVGAIPLFLAEHELSFAQALFESISGITTTGSTVIVGLDTMPPGILLWRSLLTWLGGIGIVGLGLFVLPFLKVGGASIFKLESSETNDKPFARLASFTRAFLIVYVLLTLACTIAYDLAGMDHFDALNHAMSTIATAGFSTHDMSFGYFDNNGLLVVGTVFLAISSLPFSVLILLAVRGRLDTLRDPQILVFLGYLCLISIVVAVYHHLRNGVELDDALIHSFFNITSILSTGGFASDDYTLWGPFVVLVAFFATFVGGCSGSTAGGIKAYRFVVMVNVIRAGLNKLIYPNAIYPVRYGSLTVDAETQRAVFLFVSLYIFLWVVGSVGMALLGYDVLTATSSVITALSNVGPGIGPIVGPVGNFSTISDPALYLLSLMMLLGRLEILTVLVLLTPVFWRH